MLKHVCQTQSNKCIYFYLASVRNAEIIKGATRKIIALLASSIGNLEQLHSLEGAAYIIMIETRVVSKCNREMRVVIKTVEFYSEAVRNKTT